MGWRVDGYGLAGRRVRVQRVFFKIMLSGPFITRTRLPVYPFVPGQRVRVPRVTGTGRAKQVQPLTGLANH